MATLDAMARAAEQSAGGELADSLVVEAARNVDGRNPLAVMEWLSRELRSHVRFVMDEYGGETVQNLEESWSRGAGDCDDFAVATAALARKAGLRAGFRALWAEGTDGPVAVHVLGVVEDPRSGEEIPVELTEALAFGESPQRDGGGRWETTWLQARGPAAVGAFLDFLAPVFGIFQQKEATKTAKAVAEGNVQASLVTANAARDVSKTQAATSAAALVSSEKKWAAALQYGREALPVVLKLAALAAAASIVGSLAAARRAPARRSAPAKAAA